MPGQLTFLSAGWLGLWRPYVCVGLGLTHSGKCTVTCRVLRTLPGRFGLGKPTHELSLTKVYNTEAKIFKGNIVGIRYL